VKLEHIYKDFKVSILVSDNYMLVIRYRLSAGYSNSCGWCVYLVLRKVPDECASRKGSHGAGWNETRQKPRV